MPLIEQLSMVTNIGSKQFFTLTEVGETASVSGSDFTTDRYQLSPTRAAYSRPQTSSETCDTFTAVYK